jgi:putative ABC transport system permease protein
MSLWRQLKHGLRSLIRRNAADQDIADEVRDYMAQDAANRIAAGVSPDDARRDSHLEFGNQTSIQERVRSYGWENLVDTFLSDLVYAGRKLRSNAGFSIVAVLTLSIGIGATTAIFSAVNPVLFSPLPYPDPGRIMMVWETRNTGTPMAVTFASFYGVSLRNHSFKTMAALKAWQPSMSGISQPERFEGQRVSAGYFSTLGLAPSLGRDFEASDDRHQGPNVVLLSHRLWQRRFASDAAIVGRQITLDGNLFTVLGVMPEFDNVLAPTAEIWAPLQYDISLPPDSREWGHHLQMVGRLQPGVDAVQARNELNVILKALGQQYAKGYDSSGGVPQGFVVNGLQSDLTQGVRPALLAILCAVTLVLIIACVNVTNLLLARAAQRRGEFAMRVTLGASPGRLIRQLLTESLLLAFIGGAVGMVIAKFSLKTLVLLSPAELPRLNAIRLDTTAFVFAFVITTLMGLLVGLVPALLATRKDPQAALQENSRRTAGSHQLTRRTLATAEVALAVVLLVSAGLLLRSLQRLFAVDIGFATDHLLTMQVQEYGHRYDSDVARNRFFTDALEAVRRLPGVEAAAFTSQLPLSGDYESFGVELELFPHDNADAYRYAVSPDYFAAMKIPLLRGRLLSDRDIAGAPGAVVISESFAKDKLHGEDPLGKRVRMGPAIGHADRPWHTIVGVVGDVKQLSLALTDADAFYTTPTQWAWVDNAQSLVVRTRGDAAALVPSIRQAIWSVDKDQPIARISTMDSLLNTSAAERHFALVLFEAFALAALILAAAGIYGVLSGSVTERMREIGVRCALGATRSGILALILGQGMTLTAAGLGIGLIGAALTSRLLISMLFGVSPLDAFTYFAVVVLLIVVSAAACWVPAWRAAQVDPCITLRAE